MVRNWSCAFGARLIILSDKTSSGAALDFSLVSTALLTAVSSKGSSWRWRNSLW